MGQMRFPEHALSGDSHELCRGKQMLFESLQLTRSQAGIWPGWFLDPLGGETRGKDHPSPSPRERKRWVARSS